MKQPLLRYSFFMLAAVGIAAMVPGKAIAHQVQTNYVLSDQANQADQSLELQTTFSNGEPLKGAKVTVYAPEQSFRPYATGVTDNQGRFSFNPDEAISGEWEVNIKREGHGDILRVPVTEAGIDAELMAQMDGQGEEIQDVHYASSPWIGVGAIAVAAACVGFARASGKRA
ncbi:MAG: hypothetical protein WBD47_00970 [Phormidesmis sp.]